jgi:hypothetical protein
MKKKVRIKEVQINEKVVNGISNKIVTATAEDGKPIKLSRTERQLLAEYKNLNYLDSIKKGFGNPDIVSPDFKVYKNGILKFYIH